VDYVFGLDGQKIYAGKKLVDIPILSSAHELCFSKGAKSYKFDLKMFAEISAAPMLKVFLSLPNHTRSFDRLALSKVVTLRDNLTTSIELSVDSLKVLEKRSRVAEPCAATKNYDKVGI
jgi:hypothetical protein